MEESSATILAKHSAPSGKSPAIATAVALAGWLVPGLGHLLLWKWGRALVNFLTVGTLAVVGVALRGNIFFGKGGDTFDFLGFLADLGAGVFYFIARAVADGTADVSRAGGDYGTRLFATAGVLNLLCALDAREIARGRKS